MNAARHATLVRWLEQHAELKGHSLQPASGDASFRRYFRVQKSAQSWIVMDAPPELEDSRPFVRIAGLLRSIGLNVPEIIDTDLERGFVLMSDLGDRQYLSELRDDPNSADALYGDALAALGRMQRLGDTYRNELPPYDETLLRQELALFKNWLCTQHLGLEWSRPQDAAWQAVVDVLVEAALSQPQVVVHRDYHSRNLMVCADDNPGILDFQDAVLGPLTYDLVSLLKDCYVSWPADNVRDWALHYYAALDKETLQHVSPERFWRWFELMGVQRHLKAAGIFARLKLRDGKAGYLEDVPRTLRYVVAVAPSYPELEFLHEFIVGDCLPSFMSSR